MRFLIFCFILAGIAKVASGQDCSVDNPDACETAVEGIARLEVLDEECEIKVTVNSDNGVDFGTLQKPGSGSSGGGMTLNPVDESRVPFGGVKSVSGSFPPVLETLIVDYVNCFGACWIEIISKPEVLEHEIEPEKTIDYEFLWAFKRDVQMRGWRDISTSTALGHLFGVTSESDDRVRHRFGGTISGITSDTPEGKYSGILSVMLRCTH